MGWPNCGAKVAKEHQDEDIFSSPTQLPQLDHFSGCCGYAAWDFQPEFGFQEPTLRHISLLDMFLSGPLYTSLDYASNHTLIPDGFICHSGSESNQQQQLQICNKFERELLTVEDKKSDEGFKQAIDVEIKNISHPKKLSRNTISQYFYMPITQAARELNVGLTPLKKRCRELGIRRWPCRKFVSLQTLIKNVQEIGKEEGEEKMIDIREAINILEQEKKLMEEIPDMKLKDKTKRLRQACFKANYKRRRFMGMMDDCTNSVSTTINPAGVDEKTENCCGFKEEDDLEEEEFKSFFI